MQFTSFAISSALADPKSTEALHAKVASTTTGRPLFRLDNTTLYIVADTINYDEVKLQFDVESPIILDYNKLLDSIEVGNTYDIVLDVNATKYSLIAGKTNPKTGGRAYKLTPIIGKTAQLDWVRSKLENHGVEIENMNIMGTNVMKFAKTPVAKSKVTIAKTGIGATVTVTDAAAFVEVMKSGIGRAKAYGAGLPLIVAKRS